MKNRSEVVVREPTQITPCTGVCAGFRQDAGSVETCPVIALALCKAKLFVVIDGRRVDDPKSESIEICGVLADEDGLAFCEDVGNFCGYLAHGNERPSSWRRKSQVGPV